MKKQTGGIRRRWMINSMGGVFLVILLAIVAFSVAMATYYYDSMLTGLQSRATTVISFPSMMYSDETSYYQSAATYVASNFDGKDSLELQFIDEEGQVRYSSFGLMAYTTPNTPDIAGALDLDNPQMTTWLGTDPSTGERIMAVSCPRIVDGESVAVVRFVTSLALVDQQIVWIVLIAIGVGLVLLAMFYFSNLYFVRSIIEPMQGVTEIAKRIASGSYGIQIEKQFDDEIGDLTDAVNDMSLKVKQAESMKSEFISSVSHELRTPLTAINGWGETLLNGENENYKKGMAIIVSESKRLTKMVEELLEFSRIEDGRFTLSIEPMDIKAELEDAVYTYQEFFRKEGIILTHCDCEEEFPPMDGDPERLRQVFCNLLDNAAKHGGGGGHIESAIRGIGDFIEITVRDHGPGIPEEELPHVKYKFYKGSSKARGSGIGLAVCDEIIGRHQGTMELSNGEGGGCLVTVTLPLEAGRPVGE